MARVLVLDVVMMMMMMMRMMLMLMLMLMTTVFTSLKMLPMVMPNAGLPLDKKTWGNVLSLVAAQGAAAAAAAAADAAAAGFIHHHCHYHRGCFCCLGYRTHDD